MILLNELQQLLEGARTPTEIEVAVKEATSSKEYRDLIKLIHDITTLRQKKNGTFSFSNEKYVYVVSAVGRLVYGGHVKKSIASPALTSNLAKNYRRQFQRLIDVLTAELNGDKAKPAIRTYDDDGDEDLSRYMNGETLSIHNSGTRTLHGAPRHVARIRIDSCNSLQSLEGCPTISDGSMIKITNCKNLVCLKGAPEDIGSIILESCSRLETLDGLTSANHISIVSCSKLKSLEGIGHKHLQRAISIGLDPAIIKSHVLGLMMIRGLDDIFSKHGWVSPKNPKWYYLAIAALKLSEEERALEFQHMLIDNNLSEYAQL